MAVITVPPISAEFRAELHRKLDSLIDAAANGSIQAINATRSINDYVAGYRRTELTGAVAMLFLPGDSEQQRDDMIRLRDQLNRLLDQDGDLAMAREDERQGRR